MDKLEKQTRDVIQNAIDAATCLCLATDLWTKKGLTESYIAISCAYYDKTKGTAVHAMLNLALLPHPHTGEAIGTVLDETLAEWKIPREKVSKADSVN